jgi:intein/homing endonuclease
MWNVLNNYGCTPRKSLTELFPDKSIFKDPSLIRHFIRGYFDGDGCVTYVNKEHTRVGIQILGTKEFLTEMLKYFPKESNNLSIYHNHGNESEVIRYIHTTDNKAKSILKYMYNDSKLYLQRKYDRYQALCCSDASNAESKNGEG